MLFSSGPDDGVSYQKCELLVDICGICKSQFPSFDKLREHKRLQHANFDGRNYIPTTTGHSCPKCKRRQETIADLGRHLSDVHNTSFNVRFQCVSCDDMFENQDELDLHVCPGRPATTSDRK